MTASRLEKHLAGEAISHLSDEDNIDYFIRYFKFVHRENRINEKDHDARLYGRMVDTFKKEFPDYFEK